jgi:hypothetical protein
MRAQAQFFRRNFNFLHVCEEVQCQLEKLMQDPSRGKEMLTPWGKSQKEMLPPWGKSQFAKLIRGVGFGYG